jgi:CheY-like chemotaxis protein
VVAPPHAPRRILVVEDNPDTATSFVALLQALGHTAQCTTDSRQAVPLALAFKPDVAFLDIGLPHIDGYQLAVLLRAEPALKGLCIVAVTGYGSAEDRVKSRKAGFDAHLKKPAELHLIEATLDHLYGRG